jgi:hypothetical protein
MLQQGFMYQAMLGASAGASSQKGQRSMQGMQGMMNPLWAQALSGYPHMLLPVLAKLNR